MEKLFEFFFWQAQVVLGCSNLSYLYVTNQPGLVAIDIMVIKKVFLIHHVFLRDHVFKELCD